VVARRREGARWTAESKASNARRSWTPKASLSVVTAPADHHDSPLLGETLHTVGGLPDEASVHLDRAYDSNVESPASGEPWPFTAVSINVDPYAIMDA
jgi:hypothetical protein